jgi:predicted acyl esterase
MNDGTLLATDVYVPILSKNLVFENVTLNLLGQNILIPSIKLAEKGTQLYVYPQFGADSTKFPVIYTRTPYNMQDPLQGQVESVLGYCGILQDMRGRYASQGVYLPMYSDSWKKGPYFAPSFRHPLDTTWNQSANNHQDGYESVRYIADSMRWDWNGDSLIDANDPLLCNGNIGMFGASALANTQFQAAAVAPVNPNGRGLKCLFPIVGSGEFHHSTGHFNGVFRERIIDGWLRGQVERYDWVNDPTDNTIFNSVHSLRDYGPGITTGFKAADEAVRFWTEMGSAHYPNSPFRSIMDMSHATLASDGVTPQLQGPRTRYEYLRVPIYNLTGWWDIFTEGQIETWQKLRKHTADYRKYQKIVIGPWAHQTVGSLETGDMRKNDPMGDYSYKPNVGQALGANLDNISVENIGAIANSELIDWFRKWLGDPRLNLPAVDEWQYLANIPLIGDVYVKLPAVKYQTEFYKFFNFLNGTGPLDNFPIKFKGITGVDTNQVQRVNIPATGSSVFGDVSGAVMQPAGQTEWDDTQPGGVKAIKYYVVGPINDGVDGQNGNPSVGNYWEYADTFPVAGVRWEKMYFHGDSTLDRQAPSANEGVIEYYNNPDDYVVTHGGPNMIVNTPDGQRLSQGQMNFADPQWKARVLNRPSQFINGKKMTDLVSFTSETVRDSFHITGYPRCTLYARSRPFDTQVLDTTNTDFIVRVLDVTPDGREMYVIEGAVNARARKYAASWISGVEDTSIHFANIPSDSILEYKFQMLPIAYSFGKGHRVKILISSTNHPRYQACPNVPLKQGEFFRRRVNENKSYTYYGNRVLSARSSLNGISISDAHPSSVEFPVIGKTFTSSEPSVRNAANTKLQVSVYPNPATTDVNVTVNKAGPFTAVLYSLIGNEIARYTFTGSLVIEAASLPRGIYVLNVTSADGAEKSTEKIVLR